MARQDGVITAAQARTAGMSTSAIDRRLRSGEWHRLRSGVFIRADRTRTAAVELRAAVYGSGAGALAWGPSAAWWHGLIERAPSQRWVTIPCARRVRSAPGIMVRRRDLDWPDAATNRGLRVTDVPLTVLEAAVLVPNGSVLMDRALQRDTTLPILQSVHERHAGRVGAVAAANLLRAATEGGASEAERMLQRLLRRAQINGWTPHVRSCGFEIDVAFPSQRIAIEVDGWAWHKDAERFKRDLERQNILVNAGWTVLRFTWHNLANEPDAVLDAIVVALTRAA